MKTLAIFILAMLAISGGASARELQTKFSSGGKCYAKADTSVIKDAKNGFAEAVAKAFKEACSATSAQDLVEKNVEYFETSAAAIVKVWTSAFATCTTWGKNSYGCAASAAYAKAQVSSFIKLISSAVASATNTCSGCDPSAFASNYATLLVELFAKAESLSKADVCIGPNQTASAFAYSECNAQVLAHGFAFALAKAAIQGGCTHLSAEALTEVQNYVDVDPYCKCKGWAWACVDDKCDYAWDKGVYINDLAKVVARNPTTHKYDKAVAFFKAKCEAFAYEP